jgi:hypothetical protein
MQVNGVVRTLSTTARVLRDVMEVEVLLITPEDFFQVPCPTYESIKLAVLPGSKMRRMLVSFCVACW